MGASSVTAATTLNPALGAAPTVGNVVVIDAGAFGTVSSITGIGTTSWTKVVDFADADANHDFGDIWWGTVSGTPSTTATITFSFAGFRAAHLYELTGAQKATDGTVDFANDASATTDSKTITTTTDGCFILSVCTAFQGSPAGTAIKPTGYTQAPHLSNAPSPTATLDAGWFTQTTHGASTMNWSGLIGTGFPAVAAIAVKASGTVTNLYPPNLMMATYTAT